MVSLQHSDLPANRRGAHNFPAERPSVGNDRTTAAVQRIERAVIIVDGVKRIGKEVVHKRVPQFQRREITFPYFNYSANITLLYMHFNVY